MICNELFTNGQAPFLLCDDVESKSYIRADGKIGCEHCPDGKWDLNEFVMLLREQKYVWKEIYWKMWSLTQLFHCSTCGEHFRGFDYDCCRFHPSEPKLGEGNVRIYPCCGKRALRFYTGPVQSQFDDKGCMYRNHTISGKVPFEGACDKELFMANLDLIFSNKLPPGVSQSSKGMGSKFELGCAMKNYLAKHIRAPTF